MAAAGEKPMAVDTARATLGVDPSAFTALWSSPAFDDTRPLASKDSGKEESMPPTKPPYPPEFRREAVQLTRTSKRSIAQVDAPP